jgi:hypothetical protein
MRRRLIRALLLLAVLLVTATPALAARPHMTGLVAFSTGSLIAKGHLADLDHRPVTIVLEAAGDATVVCVREKDHKYEEFPAPKHPHVSAIGYRSLDPATYVHGKVDFLVETNEPTVTPQEAGCTDDQHQDWSGHSTKVTAKVVDVSWTSAGLTLKDTQTHDTLDTRDYGCKTKGDKVKCKQQHPHDDDD